MAVTLARMRIPELPRFLRSGRPVERLVRDHPGVTFAVAAPAPAAHDRHLLGLRSVQEMEDMVRRRSAVPDPSCHAAAMAERDRRDLHHEFATYRFPATSEHGSWAGRRDVVPVRTAL